jgi:hypothetical protein
MAHKLDRHPVRVAVDADQSEQGLMVFADGVLVAVFSYLKETVDGELQDRSKPGLVPVMAPFRIRRLTVRMRRNSG